MHVTRQGNFIKLSSIYNKKSRKYFCWWYCDQSNSSSLHSVTDGGLLVILKFLTGKKSWHVISYSRHCRSILGIHGFKKHWNESCSAVPLLVFNTWENYLDSERGWRLICRSHTYLHWTLVAVQFLKKPLTLKEKSLPLAKVLSTCFTFSDSSPGGPSYRR